MTVRIVVVKAPILVIKWLRPHQSRETRSYKNRAFLTVFNAFRAFHFISSPERSTVLDTNTVWITELNSLMYLHS